MARGDKQRIARSPGGLAVSADARPTRVCVDFDGVAWSLLRGLGEVGFPLLNGERLDESNCPSWETPIDLCGGDVHLFMDFVAKARQPHVLERVGMFPGFAAGIEAMRARGLHPAIVTHAPAEVIGATRDFLRSQHGLEIEVILAKPEEKIAWCLSENAPVIIDDAPDTIRMAQKAGLTPIAPEYSYNRDAIRETGTRSTTNGWSGLLAHLFQVLPGDGRCASCDAPLQASACLCQAA